MAQGSPNYRESQFTTAADTMNLAGPIACKVVSVPTTHNLERVYRLEIPFEVRYKLLGDMTPNELSRNLSFLKANVDLQAKEIALLQESAEQRFGQPLLWENPSEILERQQGEAEDSPEQG
jgi:hypothetical protein